MVAGELACVILEPLTGACGVLPDDESFPCAARDLTEGHDVPVIFDEVLTFRLAHGGAQERYGVTPDRTALGRFIGGGLPVGAFGGRADNMSVVHPEAGAVDHSGAFNENSAASAAGVATLAALDKAAVAELNRLGERLRAGAREIAAAHDCPLTVTDDGSVFQLHGTAGPVTDVRFATATGAFADRVLAMRNRAIFLAPRGTSSLSAPMGDGEVDASLAAIRGVLECTRAAVARADTRTERLVVWSAPVGYPSIAASEISSASSRAATASSTSPSVIVSGGVTTMVLTDV